MIFKIWINPMTGQQLRLPISQTPNGIWVCIGEEQDTTTSATPNNDVDLSVGDDFSPDDDEF